MNHATVTLFGVRGGPLGRRRSNSRLAPALCAAALAIPFAAAAVPALYAQAANQELKLTVGNSVVIDYPSDIGHISTSIPDVADAVPITSRDTVRNATVTLHGTPSV